MSGKKKNITVSQETWGQERKGKWEPRYAKPKPIENIDNQSEWTTSDAREGKTG